MAKSYNEIRNEAIRIFHLQGKNPRTWSESDIQAVDSYIGRQLGKGGLGGVDPRIASVYKNQNLDALQRHEAMQKIDADQAASDTLKNLWSDGGSQESTGFSGENNDPFSEWANREDQKTGLNIPSEANPLDNDTPEDEDEAELAEDIGDHAEEPTEPGLGEDAEADENNKPKAPKEGENGTKDKTAPGLGDAKRAANASKTAGGAAGGATATAEGAATAAGGAAVTAEAGAVTAGFLPILLTIITFFLVLIALWGLFAQNPDSAGALEKSSVCAIYDPGVANVSGYYQLPVSNYYVLNINGGSPRDAQWGNKDTIELILNVGKTWSTAHPDQLFSVGDINDGGHDSHKTGIDFDIYGDNKLMLNLHTGSTNPNYDRALTIDLAKAFIDTGAVDIIGYSDQLVIDEVNKYISENKKYGTLTNWSGHSDHFHVRVKKGSYVCKDTDVSLPGVATGTLNVPYQNQFTYGHTGACAIASLAMVASFYTQTDITYDWVYHYFNTIMYSTSRLNQLLKTKGINKTFVRYETKDKAAAENALRLAEKSVLSGNPVILRLRRPFADVLHTTVITGFDKDGNVYINDPNNGRGAPPYISVGTPKGKDNLAPREAIKGAMLYIDYVK